MIGHHMGSDKTEEEEEEEEEGKDSWDQTPMAMGMEV
jgi:hypothetical protein